MNTDTNGTSDGCSALTGVCSGNLGGTGPSLDGWRWATELEVRTLFHDFAGSLNIPGFDPLPLNPILFTEPNSVWAPALVDSDGAGADSGIFDATFDGVNGFGPSVAGLTRTITGSVTLVGFVTDVREDVDTIIPDQASTASGQGTGNPVQFLGFWLYRNVTDAAVPAPSTMLLLVTGVAVLGWRRRASDWNRRWR